MITILSFECSTNNDILWSNVESLRHVTAGSLRQTRQSLYIIQLAIIHQSTKEIFDFMHLYHQYYNKICMLRIITKYHTT